MDKSTKTSAWSKDELIDGKYYYSIANKEIQEIFMPGGEAKKVTIQTDRYIQTADGKAYRAPRILRAYG